MANSVYLSYDMNKIFNNPADQACHQVEKTVLAGAAFFVWMGFFYYLINWFGLAGLGLIVIFPILILSTVGTGLYTVAIYRLGRIHWLPRLLLDAGVLFLFYLLVLRK